MQWYATQNTPQIIAHVMILHASASWSLNSFRPCFVLIEITVGDLSSDTSHNSTGMQSKNPFFIISSRSAIPKVSSIKSPFCTSEPATIAALKSRVIPGIPPASNGIPPVIPVWWIDKGGRKHPTIMEAPSLHRTFKKEMLETKLRFKPFNKESLLLWGHLL